MKLERMDENKPGYPSLDGHRMKRRSLLKVMFGGIVAAIAAGCDLGEKSGPEHPSMGGSSTPPAACGKPKEPSAPEQPQKLGEMPAPESPRKRGDIPAPKTPPRSKGAMVAPEKKPEDPPKLGGDIAVPEKPVDKPRVRGLVAAPAEPSEGVKPEIRGKIRAPKPPAK